MFKTNVNLMTTEISTLNFVSCKKKIFSRFVMFCKKKFCEFFFQWIQSLSTMLYFKFDFLFLKQKHVLQSRIIVCRKKFSFSIYWNMSFKKIIAKKTIFIISSLMMNFNFRFNCYMNLRKFFVTLIVLISCDFKMNVKTFAIFIRFEYKKQAKIK